MSDIALARRRCDCSQNYRLRNVEEVLAGVSELSDLVVVDVHGEDDRVLVGHVRLENSDASCYAGSGRRVLIPGVDLDIGIVIVGVLV